MNVIGIDVGGTKIMAGIINSAGEIISKIEARTPVESGRAGILSCIIELIRKLQLDGPVVQAIGIGSAGRLNRTSGQVIFATDNLPGWIGTPLKGIMETTFSLPVFVDNDVNTAALGEGWLGAGQGRQHYMLVTLGTGVGGALIHKGQIVDGQWGGAGEIGHMIIYPGGICCNCGQVGCLEQYASGTALNRLAYNENKDWDSRELMTQLELQNQQAKEVINSYVEDLAIALISLFNIYDPELIIIGGGVIDSHVLWWDKLKEQIRLKTQHNLMIAPAILGNEAGMLGAARYAFNEMMIGNEKGELS